MIEFLKKWFSASRSESTKTVSVQERGAVVSGTVGGNLITGDNNRIKNRMVKAETYIENQYINGKPADEAKLRQAYLHRVMKLAGNLPLGGVDRKAAGDCETRLDLGAVYTALLIRSADTEKFASSDREMHRKESPVSVLSMLDRHKYLVLLGDPGSGKSTFVNFAALCLAGENLADEHLNLKLLTAPLPRDEKDKDDEEKEKSQPWHHGSLLPVIVILRDFVARGLPEKGEKAGAGHLLNFVLGELEKPGLADYAPFLKQEMQGKNVLMLLDGLDEVPEAGTRREQIRQSIEDFVSTFSECRVLVTSRTYAYQKQNWRLSGFAEAQIAPFSAGQIRQFIERWYAHMAQLRGMNAEDAKGRAELLKQVIFASDRLSGLAERPLLLTLMASLHAWRGGSLPEKREELYADTVDLLLDWWESPKIVRDSQGNATLLQPSLAEWLNTDREQIRNMLNELAYHAHRSQPQLTGTADISGRDLLAGLMKIRNNPDVKPARLIEYLSERAGLLLPRGEDVYTFPHRTFQEYLAACFLTDEDYPDLLAELAKKEPNRWREAVLLAGAKAAGGSASAVWTLAEELCLSEPQEEISDFGEIWGALLAGQLLGESADMKRAGKRNQPKLERIQQWQIRIMRGRELPPVERALAGRTLAVLGDPRPEVLTLEAMQFCRVPAGNFLMGDGEEQHENTCLHYDFWLGRFPVTNAQYSFFVKDGGYGKEKFWAEAVKEGFWKQGKFKGRWDNDFRDRPYELGIPYGYPNHPVVGITWYEALAFVRWLTEKWKEMLPEKWAVRLPSEAEWEKAARGGLKIPEKPLSVSVKDFRTFISQNADSDLPKKPNSERIYPWGNEEDIHCANVKESGIESTSAVGAFAFGKSPYGCEDMSGNVWEWTRSLNGEYPYDPNDGRENPEKVTADSWIRVRGGSYYIEFKYKYARCGFRDWLDPNDWSGHFGFRMLLSPFTLGSDPSEL